MTPTIAIICNTSLHVQRCRTNLIKTLQSTGAKIVVVSPYDEAVAALESAGVLHAHVDISQYGTSPLREVLTFLAIRKALRRHRPSVCLCFTIKPNTVGAMAAQSLGITVINNIAGLGRAFEDSGPLLRRLVVRLYAAALRRSHRVFFQNSDDLSFFLEHRMVPEPLVRRLPGSGVDLKRFAPSFEFPTDPVFLFVGRLLIAKGAKMFIDAAMEMARLGTNAKFLIAGERLDESGYVSAEDLEAFSTCEGCTYLGQVPANQIEQQLAACSFLVLPSYYGEGVPRTLLEAGAVGRPIITTDSVGCRDVIRHMVNGLKIAPRDGDALLAAMRKAAGFDKDTLVTMGKQSREIVEKQFDEEIVLRAYVKECERLLGRDSTTEERVVSKEIPQVAELK